MELYYLPSNGYNGAFLRANICSQEQESQMLFHFVRAIIRLVNWSILHRQAGSFDEISRATQMSNCSMIQYANF